MSKRARKKRQTPQLLGYIVGMSESRDLLTIKDTLGNVAELRPLKNDPITLRLKLQMPLASGRSIEFWGDAPQEISKLLEEYAMVPRSVQELLNQFENDLKGVKDDHDKVVDAHEQGAVYAGNPESFERQEAFESRLKSGE